MNALKPIRFLGDSLDQLRGFSEMARRRAGHQLDLVQHGRDPDDWKPMTSVGAGVREIRVRDENGIYRVMYVTKFGEFVYVLHCFEKKTQKTPSGDLQISIRRYKDLQKEHSK